MGKLKAPAIILSLLVAISCFPLTAACEKPLDSEAACPFSVQLMAGYLGSPVLHPDRADMDYGKVDLRLCWFSGPNKTARWLGLEGPFEFILGLTYASIVDGPGNYFAGMNVLIRYYFFAEKRRFMPYFQLGAGIIYNDVYKDKSQDVIGQSVEFTPQGSLGMHYFLNRRWALDAEIIYHHISNAGLDDRNEGVNALGGLVGVTYRF